MLARSWAVERPLNRTRIPPATMENSQLRAGLRAIVVLPRREGPAGNGRAVPDLEDVAVIAVRMLGNRECHPNGRVETERIDRAFGKRVADLWSVDPKRSVTFLIEDQHLSNERDWQ